MKNNSTIYYFHIHIHKTTRTFDIDIGDRGCGMYLPYTKYHPPYYTPSADRMMIDVDRRSVPNLLNF